MDQQLIHAADKETDESIGVAAKMIFQFLWDAEYFAENGQRRPVRGDISKLTQLIGLSSPERAVVENYNLMSSSLPGTRHWPLGMLAFGSKRTGLLVTELGEPQWLLSEVHPKSIRSPNPSPLPTATGASAESRKEKANGVPGIPKATENPRSN